MTPAAQLRLGVRALRTHCRDRGATSAAGGHHLAAQHYEWMADQLGLLVDAYDQRVRLESAAPAYDSAAFNPATGGH